MSDRGNGGTFGFIQTILAIIGALTVAGIAAVAVSVLAWEMELRRTEQAEGGAPQQPSTPPPA